MMNIQEKTPNFMQWFSICTVLINGSLLEVMLMLPQFHCSNVSEETAAFIFRMQCGSRFHQTTTCYILENCNLHTYLFVWHFIIHSFIWSVWAQVILQSVCACQQEFGGLCNMGGYFSHQKTCHGVQWNGKFVIDCIQLYSLCLYCEGALCN
jgi:hypothetical protein